MRRPPRPAALLRHLPGARHPPELYGLDARDRRRARRRGAAAREAAAVLAELEAMAEDVHGAPADATGEDGVEGPAAHER